MELVDDRVAKSARFSSLTDEGDGPKRMQDFREELSRKKKELREEEHLARLERFADRMRTRRRSLISSLRF